MNVKEEHSHKVYGFDILRAYAILCVVYEHGGYMVWSYINPLIYYLPLTDTANLFFVLSGFLIGSILLRIINRPSFGKIDLFNFWIARWCRTLPLYYLVLISMMLYQVLVLRYSLVPGFYKFFFFLQNFWDRPLQFFQISWTLAIEEWFYFTVPLLLYLTIRFTNFKKHHILLFYIATIVLFCTAIRTYRVAKYGYLAWDDWDECIRRQVITRLDSIMFGVLAAYIKYYKEPIWNSLKEKAFWPGVALLLFSKVGQGLGLLHVLDTNIIWGRYFALTATSIGTLMLLPKLSSITTGKGLIYRFLTFISRISYSMYLLHYSFVQLIFAPMLNAYLKKVISTNSVVDWSVYILYWFITIGLAFLLNKYFEIPTTNLRDKFKVLLARSTNATVTPS